MLNHRPSPGGRLRRSPDTRTGQRGVVLILALIVLLSSNKKIMKEWTNRPLTTVLGWMVTVFMGVASLLTIWYLVLG